MKNPKVQFVLVTVLLIAAGLLLIPSLTQATPKGVPAWRVDEPQRDGYSRSFVVDANSVLFTVPEGRCYVLVRMYARVSDNEPPYMWEFTGGHYDYYRDLSYWTLTIDGQTFLDEVCIAHPYVYQGNATMSTIDGLMKEDFPDGYVVINGGQTLGITKHEAIDKVCLTLIGYFCDAR
ncbi:MAG: hypothetical protein ACYTFX_09455 [Planctomycetota bacterium]|jgi:hypothetical protein